MKRAWPLLAIPLLLAGYFLAVADFSPAAPPESTSPDSTDQAIWRRPRASSVPIPTMVDTPIVVPEVEAPPRGEAAYAKTLKWLLQHQNEDGSWGSGPAVLEGHAVDAVGTTSLALLAFLGTGFTHLTRDLIDDIQVGSAVKRALQWLKNAQREDGTFITCGDAALEQALATLALGEAYGMTATQVLKEPAQRAVQALERMQLQDGSFGDMMVSTWAAEALVSARLSELEYDPERVKVAAEMFKGRLAALGDRDALLGGVLLSRQKQLPGMQATASLMAEQPPQGTASMMKWYFGSLALFQFDGPDGRQWNTWNGPMKSAIVGGQEADGSWGGAPGTDQTVRTSLGWLTLAVYYRYGNNF